MYRSRLLVSWAAVVFAVAGATGLAADASKPAAVDEKQYIAVATARVKLELAWQQIGPLFNQYIQGQHKTRNGWDAAWDATEAAHTKIVALLNDALNTETAKGAAKEEAFIRACTDRLELTERDWKINRGPDASEADLKWTDACKCWDAVWRIYGAATRGGPANDDLEGSCKGAQMDIAPLAAIYAAQEKRLLELQAVAQQSLDVVKQQSQTWEGKLTEVQSFLAARTGAR